MQEKLRRGLALLVTGALIASIGVLGGCTPQSDSSGGDQGDQPVKGGTMSYYIGEPAYIDPYNTQESEGTQVEQALFDSLTVVDPLDATKVLPAAAESWSASEDAKVWTFKLKQDAKFADGTPVTAKDFIYAWNRIANPKTKNTATGKEDPSIISYHLAPVAGYADVQGGKATEMSGLKAVDDYTLEVTLDQPFADFDYVVAHPALAPVPQALVEAGVDNNGEKVAFGEMPMGNGPFVMAEPWVPGQYIKVVRNENYAGDAAYLDGVDFRIFKDPNTAYTEFKAGTLDFSQIGEGQIKAAATEFGESENGYTANPGKQALLGEETAIYYLVFNTKDKAMADENLRKAVTLAINRQAICDTVYEGTRSPADNIVPPGIAGYEKGVWADSKYDQAAAKQALADAGYPDGKGAPELTLSFNNDGGHEKVMQLVQSDLQAIGLKVKFDTADFPTYLKTLDAGKFQFGRLGWLADYTIMDNFLYPIFYTGSGDNKSAFSDKTVDENIDKARSTIDQAARLALYNEANKTIQASNPVAPLVFYKHHHIASDKVHDLTYSPMGLTDFTKVWLTGGAGGSTETTSN